MTTLTEGPAGKQTHGALQPVWSGGLDQEHLLEHGHLVAHCLHGDLLLTLTAAGEARPQAPILQVQHLVQST